MVTWTSNQMLFVICAEYNRCSYREMLTLQAINQQYSSTNGVKKIVNKLKNKIKKCQCLDSTRVTEFQIVPYGLSQGRGT